MDEAYFSVEFSEFDKASCRLIEEPLETICDLLPSLNSAGIVYIIFSILVLLSLVAGIIHFLLIMIVRIKPFPMLSYTHVISSPLYIISTILYFTISTFYSIPIDTKTQSGIILLYITSLIGLFQVCFYIYIKKFKD